MIFKSADDKTKDIRILNELRRHPQATDAIIQDIDQEIRNLELGITGEAEAAKIINFHYGKGATQWVVIHDLRIKVGSRFAQIDHLIINRLAEIYVCETKYRQYGISINEHGEFSAIKGDGSLQGIQSPIEQNLRHIDVLEDAFKSGQLPLPRRFIWFRVKPLLHSLILISSNARIDRPKRPFDGMESILKSDQLMTGIYSKHKPLDSKNLTIKKPHMLLWSIFHAYRLLPRLIPQREMTSLAKKLVAEHRPAVIDWYAKFELSKDVPILPEKMPEKGVEPAGERKEEIPSGCHSCGGPMSSGEIDYCHLKASAFGKKLLCMSCQRKIKRVPV